MAKCTINLNSGKKLLSVESGIRLIDALAISNIYLPSACGSSGRCGLCKVKVINSADVCSKSEIELLSDADRNTGIRLGCQIQVFDGMQIEIPSEYLNAQEFISVLKRKRFLTRDIVELTLELKSPASISFNAGQYVTLKMPAAGDKKAVMRPFSIASSTAEHSFIQLNIRLNPSGIVTPWIFQELTEGQEVRFSGPRGRFFIQNSQSPMLFIAGGSGMAPVRSILRTMADHSIRRSAVFFFGALTQNDLFYLDEMEIYREKLGDFKFIPALSNEPENSTWNGERGLITEVMNRNLECDASGYEAYLCGKPAMIEGCIPMLVNKEIPKDRIFFDLFSSPSQQSK